MDERTVIINIAKAYKELVSNSFPVKIDQCWLFGSYAKGTPREYSDIDIALVVNHIEDEDYWKGTTLLWRLSNHIDDRIEPHVIARDTDYAGFLDEIQRTGVEV
jgi:predicted nucleotidyltransferase